MPPKIELAQVDAPAPPALKPPVDPATLAYALIRLRHAFLYHDTMVGIRGDHARLREVQAALLGISPAPRRGVTAH